jgi:small multidrug resistance pump
VNEIKTPSWMKSVLNAAAVYNLVWGTFVVLFPSALFRAAGLEPPNYPSITQCLGMVIGVYGIGYAIAARDPVTHWPVIFVGLLGKVFGPIGFVWTAWHGELPWSAGVMLLANDLAWWIPFTAILMHAAKVQGDREMGTETPA